MKALISQKHENKNSNFMTPGRLFSTQNNIFA